MGDYVQERMQKAKLAELMRKGMSEEKARKLLGLIDKSRGEASRTVAYGFLIAGAALLVIGILRLVSYYSVTGGGLSRRGLFCALAGVANLILGIQRWRAGTSAVGSSTEPLV